MEEGGKVTQVYGYVDVGGVAPEIMPYSVCVALRI